MKGSRVPDFELMNTLGTGSFGRVKLVRHKGTKKVFALKCLSKSLVIRTKQAEHILAEKEILASIMHPFIVNLYATFQDETSLYFALEFVIGGEFFTHLRKANRFPEHTARFFAASVVAAFEHLHGRDIIYRDLKPENLLLDKNGYLKVRAQPVARPPCANLPSASLVLAAKASASLPRPRPGASAPC